MERPYLCMSVVGKGYEGSEIPRHLSSPRVQEGRLQPSGFRVQAELLAARRGALTVHFLRPPLPLVPMPYPLPARAVRALSMNFKKLTPKGPMISLLLLVFTVS